MTAFRAGGYQAIDHEIVDYQIFKLPGTSIALRGPAPRDLETGNYFACFGAAETFGRFTTFPYPQLLAEQLELDALNLGVGGATARLLVEDATLLEYARRARFVVVQVASARAEENSVFARRGRASLTRRSDGAALTPHHAYDLLLQTSSRSTVRRVVAETRASWVAGTTAVLQALDIPTVLFWFSRRSPEYTDSYSSANDLFGGFPQLVNAAMLTEVRPLATSYVECVTSRGAPQSLVSRFTGNPTICYGPGHRQGAFINSYYPSPEMHVDAAAALLPACRGLH